MGDAALVACNEGWTPGVVAGVGQRVRAAQRESPPTPLEPVEIVLSGRAESIDGTLFGRDDAPASGWRIALLDGVPAFRSDHRPLSAEEVSAGTRGHVETGPDGGFAFVGLAPERAYRVRAWNPRTLEQVTSEPIPAGTRGHVLRVPDFSVRPLVDGVDALGETLPSSATQRRAGATAGARSRSHPTARTSGASASAHGGSCWSRTASSARGCRS